MLLEASASDAAHIIQLSVAPVFLLTGVAGLLNVMTTRLGRVIDRSRAIQRDYYTVNEAARRDLDEELSNLNNRLRIINLAITLVTISALFVCAVVAGLFVGAFLEVDSTVYTGLLFILAMLTLIVGLLIFLREVDLATRTMRFTVPRLPE